MLAVTKAFQAPDLNKTMTPSIHWSTVSYHAISPRLMVKRVFGRFSNVKFENIATGICGRGHKEYLLPFIRNKTNKYLKTIN